MLQILAANLLEEVWEALRYVWSCEEYDLDDDTEIWIEKTEVIGKLKCGIQLKARKCVKKRNKINARKTRVL